VPLGASMISNFWNVKVGVQPAQLYRTCLMDVGYPEKALTWFEKKSVLNSIRGMNIRAQKAIDPIRIIKNANALGIFVPMFSITLNIRFESSLGSGLNLSQKNSTDLSV
jgi:hypothetical protein